MLNRIGQTLRTTFSGLLLSIEERVEEDNRYRDWLAIEKEADEALTRMGFSPALVRKGPEYWPWAEGPSAVKAH